MHRRPVLAKCDLNHFWILMHSGQGDSVRLFKSCQICCENSKADLDNPNRFYYYRIKSKFLSVTELGLSNTPVVVFALFCLLKIKNLTRESLTQS